MRGLIAALLLRHLDELVCHRLGARGLPSQPLSSFFDVIAGTSTGAIIAAGIAGRSEAGQPLSDTGELVSIYREEARPIFARSWAGLFSPKYRQESLDYMFRKICGNARLSEVATNVVIPSFEIGQAQAFVFRGGPQWPRGSVPDYKLSDVLLATTAAPYLFAPAYISPIGDAANLQAFVDGGTFANNPSLHAYLEARQLFDPARAVLILSIGIGGRLPPIDYHQARRWGAAAWLNPRAGMPLIQLILHAQSDDTHGRLRRLVPDTRAYVRLTAPPTLQLPLLDDVSPQSMEILSQAAEAIIHNEGPVLRHIAERLIGSEP